ncbi:hypothetical protein EW026_g5405 [Hermanssonia centrifuga]|uniref:DUF6534 domain-containing protein n=1 Tax=Hermanssonia centrifuga TaxID=98765 RepID=A0A4S4KE85_9APHY|nr:hypothetical protein EW026_g5405 [Hermanssonia centrifuga]
MQVYLYYRVYTKDALYMKTMVSMIWLLDILHTIMTSAANWTYLVVYFGNASGADHITCTFIVHGFFAHRIHTVSKGNMYITGPLGLLATFRLVIALVTTAEMIRTGFFHIFVGKFAWVFTMGLASSAALDVIIAGGLCYYLRRSKSGMHSMDQVIDVLVLYTVETGLVTCLTTILSLVCWLTMSHNLIYLGLHFTISKLYANSFLATLNSRKSLRAKSQASSDRDRDGHPMPVLFPNSHSRRRFSMSRREVDVLATRTVEISVEKTIHREIDGETIEVPLDGEHSNGDDDRSSDKRSVRDL